MNLKARKSSSKWNQVTPALTNKKNINLLAENPTVKAKVKVEVQKKEKFPQSEEVLKIKHQ